MTLIAICRFLLKRVPCTKQINKTARQRCRHSSRQADDMTSRAASNSCVCCGLRACCKLCASTSRYRTIETKNRFFFSCWLSAGPLDRTKMAGRSHFFVYRPKLMSVVPKKEQPENPTLPIGPVASPGYTKLSESLRKKTPAAVACLAFCGGKKCRFDTTDRWTAEDMAIDGLYSHWYVNNLLTRELRIRHN